LGEIKYRNDVCREVGRGKTALMLRSRDEDLAAEMATLLFGRQPILEMDTCGG
jgi:hypothetical protein